MIGGFLHELKSLVEQLQSSFSCISFDMSVFIHDNEMYFLHQSNTKCQMICWGEISPYFPLFQSIELQPESLAKKGFMGFCYVPVSLFLFIPIWFL